MSFSGLSDLFEGQLDSRKRLAFLLSLKVPEGAKQYLLESHPNPKKHSSKLEQRMEISVQVQT
jgi:hypothetical protein